MNYETITLLYEGNKYKLSKSSPRTHSCIKCAMGLNCSIRKFCVSLNKLYPDAEPFHWKK